MKRDATRHNMQFYLERERTSHPEATTMTAWVIAIYDKTGQLVGLRTYHGSEKSAVYTIRSRAVMVAERMNRSDPDHSHIVEDASAHTIIR